MKPRRLAALGAAVLAAVVLFVSDPVLGASASGPHEPRTPIKHFIVLMQEDHTFDNYFGTYPGADGIPAGTRMPLDPLLGKRPFALPFHLTDEPLLQMSHGKDAALAAWREGRMDGFLAAQSDLRGDARRLPMGFYDRHDLPYYWKVAEDYVLFDRFFSSAMGGSYLNHVYWVAGGPGNVDEAVPDGGLDALTIFDRLQRAGVSWKFYVQDYDPERHLPDSPAPATSRCRVADREISAAHHPPVPGRPGAAFAHRRPGRVLQGPAQRDPA